MKLKIPTAKTWEQIDGDVNIATYGGTLARSDGSTIELVKIQPVREYVGNAEAAEVGYPFWTKEGSFWIDDLERAVQDQGFMNSMDLDNILEGLTPNQAALAVASSMLDYGWGDEGPSGWAADIDQGFPADVKEALLDEDEEFKQEVLWDHKWRDEAVEALEAFWNADYVGDDYDFFKLFSQAMPKAGVDWGDLDTYTVSTVVAAIPQSESEELIEVYNED